MKLSILLFLLLFASLVELMAQGQPLRIRENGYWISGDSLTNIDSLLVNEELSLVYQRAISARMIARKIFIFGLTMEGGYLIADQIWDNTGDLGNFNALVLRSTMLIVGSTAVVTAVGVQVYALVKRKQFRNKLKFLGYGKIET